MTPYLLLLLLFAIAAGAAKFIYRVTTAKLDSLIARAQLALALA